MLNAFGIFEKPGKKGYIDALELKKVIMNVAGITDDEEIDDLLMEAEIDGDGLIKYADFVKQLCKRDIEWKQDKKK